MTSDTAYQWRSKSGPANGKIKKKLEREDCLELSKFQTMKNVLQTCASSQEDIPAEEEMLQVLQKRMPFNFRYGRRIILCLLNTKILNC